MLGSTIGDYTFGGGFVFDFFFLSVAIIFFFFSKGEVRT